MYKMNLYESVSNNLKRTNTFYHFDERKYKPGDYIEPKGYKYTHSKAICDAYKESTGLDISKLIYTYKYLKDCDPTNESILYQVELENSFKGISSYSPYMCMDCLEHFSCNPEGKDISKLVEFGINLFAIAYNPANPDSKGAQQELKRLFNHEYRDTIEYITDKPVKVIKIIRGGN